MTDRYEQFKEYVQNRVLPDHDREIIHRIVRAFEYNNRKEKRKIIIELLENNRIDEECLFKDIIKGRYIIDD